MNDIIDAVIKANDRKNRLVELLYIECKGRIVTINTGKYKGYKAKLDHVVCDRYDESPTVLCYVLGKKTGVPLNSDGETRSYRPFNQFTFD